MPDGRAHDDQALQRFATCKGRVGRGLRGARLPQRGSTCEAAAQAMPTSACRKGRMAVRCVSQAFNRGLRAILMSATNILSERSTPWSPRMDALARRARLAVSSTMSARLFRRRRFVRYLLVSSGTDVPKGGSGVSCCILGFDGGFLPRGRGVSPCVARTSLFSRSRAALSAEMGRPAPVTCSQPSTAA